MSGAAHNPIDPASLMRIKNLELRARIVVEGFWRGLHRSPLHGFSVEFSEYRPYTKGDDPRFIDWKVFARTDRHYIKRFEDETNLTCHLFVDQSRSMRFASETVSKAEYTRTLAATLSYFLASQGDAVGLATFDDQLRERIPARNRPGHLRRLLSLLERESEGRATEIGQVLEGLPGAIRKRSLMVLISDFLVPVERLEPGLKLLGAAGHDVVLIRVLDGAEVDFRFEKAVHFEDAESGELFFIQPGAARQTYLERFAEHRAELEMLTSRLGHQLVTMRSDQPLELALWEFVSGRKGAGVLARTRRARNVG